MKNKLFVIIIFCSSCLFSQYTETINSNRPGTSHGAFSVGRDVLQFEVGLKNYSLTHSNLNNSKINYPFKKKWQINTEQNIDDKNPYLPDPLFFASNIYLLNTKGYLFKINSDDGKLIWKKWKFHKKV